MRAIGGAKMKRNLEKNNTVLVDMDGVLADLDGLVLERLPREIARVARLNFYLEDDYPSHIEHVQTIMNHPQFFYELPLIDGAVEGWQRLLDLGYSPQICSAPLPSNAGCIDGKRSWLEEHLVPKFGVSVVDEAILDHEKYNYDGIVLIDDRPEVKTGNGRAKWLHVVFDRTYNQNSSATLRLHGWQDPNLPGIIESARNRHP